MTVFVGQREPLPIVSIRDAAPGANVKIYGRVVFASEPLVGPITNRRCAHYEIMVLHKVKEMGRGGNSSTGEISSTIIREQKTRDFWIDDGTGLAYLPGAPSVIFAARDGRFEQYRFDKHNPDVEALLARHGLTGQGSFFSKRLTFLEGVLEEGELVTARGIVNRFSDASAYRDGRTRVVLAPPPDDKILVTDGPTVDPLRPS